MIIECQDLDRILRDSDPAELAALEAHASTCAACAQELATWNNISVAAREMRKSWDSPLLWPRIERALELQGQEKASGSRWNLGRWRFFGATWQTAMAVALLAVLTTSAVWLVVHRSETAIQPDSKLLTDAALHEVERAEAAYVRAIDKLAAQAQLRLTNPATALAASYREKLLVIDTAIAELRANIEQNQSNTHLRVELAAMYREKKETLEAVIREE